MLMLGAGVALPKQSISVVKGDNTPKTRRNLTFDELVAHARHYNAGVRIGRSSNCVDNMSSDYPGFHHRRCTARLSRATERESTNGHSFTWYPSQYLPKTYL